MKRTKEIETILTAIFVLNHINENNEQIALLSEYALHDICEANSNMVKLITCTGNKADLTTWIKNLLENDTKYNDFLRLKEYYKKEQKNDGKGAT